jgi:hypothetical protein
MHTYAHSITSSSTVQNIQGTKLIDPTVLMRAAIFCEVSAKPNYQTTKEMNMIEQERKKNT